MKIKKLNEAIEPQNTMKIMPLSGLNADGFTVIVIDSEGNEIFNKEYRYGVDASYDRRFAKWAEDDYNNAKKYGWKTSRALKPYVADIIDELCSKYGIDKNSIDFVAGKNIFSGGNVTDDFVSRMRQRVYESKSVNEGGSEYTMTPEVTKVLQQIARLYKFFDYKKDVAKVKFRSDVIRQLQIFCKWYLEEANSTKPDTRELKNFAIQIANIVRTRNVVNESKTVKALGAKGKKLEEDTKPSQEQIARVNELVDDFKAYNGDPNDTESFSEWLKQFGGFTNKGTNDILRVWKYIKQSQLNEASYDGPYGAYDVKRLVSGRGSQDWWVLKEIEMDFGDGAKVAAYLKRRGINVEFNADDETWFVRGQYHFTDCYFYPYAYAHEDEESLTEGARPSQATLDDCLEYYLNNAFGYDGVEDYVDTEFPHHDNAFKAEVVNYIKERKHLDEGATQYGVHQFSTDSIIFRGTEQECGEYIDNNQKLWDDAEVYRMEPGDPHYKKMDEAVEFDSEKYVGMEAAFDSRNDDWSDAEEIIEYDGQSAKIKGCAVDNDSFRDSYWDIVFEDGTEFGAISGYNLTLQKSIREASYGGAYDIEDDQYFTRDDLNSFAEEVLGHISETFNGKYDIGGVWFENGSVITQIVDDIGNEFEDTTKVNMRRIRGPHHLRRMYALPVASNIIQKIKENDGHVISENAQGEGKYSDTFHQYLEWLLDEGKEDNIGYLASQLIRYCPEEDLKDLWHDRMEKVARTVGYTDAEDQSVVTEGLDDAMKLKAELQTALRNKGLKLNAEYGTVDDAVEYIMSSGGEITVDEWIKETQKNYPEYFKESLTEDVEVPTLTGPEEGPKSGVAALINEAIQEELKTVQMYNDIAVTARAEGFEEIAGQIDEINTEENKHIGQLQEVLKTVAPNAQAIDAGELEAGDAIMNVEEDTNNSNNTPNNNIEEDVSMKKERWEDIYNSFKAVEKELNQDGEAVTAVVDKMYQDNKDDPDYKKAYDKWASGE